MQVPTWEARRVLPQQSRHLPQPGATQVSVKVKDSAGGTSATMALVYRQSFLGQVQSSGLLDFFPGATILLSTTKENKNYFGTCFRVRRVSDNVEQDISWNGKNADAAALTAFLGGSTGRVSKWYDQSGSGNDAIQATTTKQWLAFVDADGKISFQADANGQGMEVADSATFKTAKVHAFIVLNGGNPPGGGAEAGVFVAHTPIGSINTSANWMIGDAYGENGTLGKTVLNATVNYFAFGMGHVRSLTSNFVVWDYSTEDQQLRVDGGHVVNPGSGSTNISYAASSLLIIGNARGYTNSFRGLFRSVILYGTTRTDRDSISGYLNSSSSMGISPLPWSFSRFGFNWNSNFLPPFSTDATDHEGLNWVHQFGGYEWPSFAQAVTSNSTDYVRFEVRPGDSDVNVTAAARSERSATGLSIAKGTDAEIFSQFVIESGSIQTGSWALTFQIHNDDASSVADMVFLNLLNEVFQIVTQRSGQSDTQRGSPVAIVRDAMYAIRISLHWSANGTSDTLSVWLGQNGTTLTQIVNVSGSIFTTDVASAYIKQGLYTGSPNAPIAMRIANYQFSATAGAFASFVTSQPALPA